MAESEVAWYNVIERFKIKAREFGDQYQLLASMESTARSNPALYKEWREKMDSAESIKSKIETVTSAIDKVSGWFGLDGAGIAGHEMGIVPLIPIAVAAAAISAASYWITDAYVFTQKLQEVQRLESRGISPERASALVSNMAPQSMFNFGGLKALVPIAALTALFFMGRKKRGN